MEPNRRFIFWLLEGTRGGPTRVRLLSLLSAKPMNLRQLALSAHLNYSTVEHHIRLLERHLIVQSPARGYGQVYMLNDSMAQDYLDGQLQKGEPNEKRKNKRQKSEE